MFCAFFFAWRIIFLQNDTLNVIFQYSNTPREHNYYRMRLFDWFDSIHLISQKSSSQKNKYQKIQSIFFLLFPLKVSKPVFKNYLNPTMTQRHTQKQLTTGRKRNYHQHNTQGTQPNRAVTAKQSKTKQSLFSHKPWSRRNPPQLPRIAHSSWIDWKKTRGRMMPMIPKRPFPFLVLASMAAASQNRAHIESSANEQPPWQSICWRVRA